MNLLAVLAVTLLAFWMVACVWCGFHKRFLGFATVLISGLTLNMFLMRLGLQVGVLDPMALMAHAACVLYGFSGFGFGWLAGRVRREWQDSRVD